MIAKKIPEQKQIPLAIPHPQKRTREVQGPTQHIQTAAARKAHPAKRLTRVTSRTTYNQGARIAIQCRARPCSKDGCKKIHHKLLHQDHTPIDETNGQISSINVHHKKGKIFLKIIPVEISGPLDRFEPYVLLVEGSTTILIERDVALKIAPPRKRETL
ncbi:hypothetical protein EVAR_60672_1 [Eumeta japonica]|uniref:Uncharacterized protein n=1 Tax=Eumeta variegata TaxID=151549 RepID=A0A4C1ZUU0_EUMVA|nr:hypothetical protein EVAR_60672_1 [Eumeta japonica]